MEVEILLFTLLPELVDEVKGSILSDNLEADVDVEEYSMFFHDESSIETRPNLDLVGVKRVSLCRVEALSAYGFKSESSHEGVKEDFEEVHVVSVSRLHKLHPVDLDSVLGSIKLSFKLGYLFHLLKTVDAVSPFDVEL